MCLNPVRLHRYHPGLNRHTVDVVSCGKCLECLRRKQSDYAFLSTRQASESGSIIMLTLTYRNSTLPFKAVFELYDVRTGAYIDRSKPVDIKEEFLPIVRQDYISLSPTFVHNDGSTGPVLGWQLEIPTSYAKDPEPLPPLERKEWLYTPGRYTDMRKVRQNVYSPEYLRSLTDSFDCRCYCTPSVDRKAVSNWLKLSRTRYKRQYGYNMSFKYFEVQEYGSHSNRPHVHILLYGTTIEQAEFLANQWRELYGRVDVETVRARRGDSLSQAYEKVSRYLAKYLCKGEFEQSFVTDGYVEKPRRVSSRRLGTENLDDLRSYILGFDVFGEYDPDHPPAKVLKPESLDMLLSRRYLSRYNSDGDLVLLRIPKLIYQRCLSKTYGLSKDRRKELGFCRSKDPAFVFRCSHERSLLSRKLATRAKLLSDSSFEQRFKAAENIFRSGLPLDDFRRAFKAIQSLSENDRVASAKIYRKQLSDFYAKSRD